MNNIDYYNLMSRAWEINPMPQPSAVIKGDKYRISVLTPRLLRLEYSEQGYFEDNITFMAINRDFGTSSYRLSENDSGMTITTEFLEMFYDKQEFSPNGLQIKLKGNLSIYFSEWRYGDNVTNLLGTARTLDESNGAVPLDNGLLSYNGFSVIDDSRSMTIDSKGIFSPPRDNRIDLYFFAYGRDYKGCLRDFFHLSGRTPRLPRYALGNWWSRYYRYTDSEYLALMDRFRDEEIPFSVAVIDMDWHRTDVNPKYGSSWTGYSWDKELFPEPEKFLSALHQRGLRTTLNLHPADGIRAFEDCYQQFAEYMGVDTSMEDPVSFNFSDTHFIHGYFKYVLAPMEEQGVDFWWVDYQQKSGSRIKGIDVLWLLNHYHYLDNIGKGNLTLSRYPGAGGHRYPIGFSGDTAVTWDSLQFQPYFTATASNIGYCWWSHDIGGHMHGVRDEELALRWLQYGVFSPVLRMHSCNNPFNSKETWNFSPEIEQHMKNALKLRHELLPYIYTMNYLCSDEGIPPIMPMYYENPEDTDAYTVPNQYYFGSEIIACPITKPCKKEVNSASFTAWMPEGDYIDFFNARHYTGGRKIDLYRDLESIPLLVKSGGIIPCAASEDRMSVENPHVIELKIFAGESGEYTLIEDDGNLEDHHTLRTNVRVEWQNGYNITISTEGDRAVVPEDRVYRIVLIGAPDGSCPNYPTTYDSRKKTLRIEHDFALSDCNDLHITLTTPTVFAPNNTNDDIFALLFKAGIEYDLKTELHAVLMRENSLPQTLSTLHSMKLDNDLYGALVELLCAV